MKLCVTFLLVLMILPSVTGEKTSERTLSGAPLRGDRGTCSYTGRRCRGHSNCCGDLCCYGNTCVVAFVGC
uniref:Conopeptide n=1 Tax=Conus lenavati TaxID=1519839 RepID=A0A0K8TUB8_CONLV